MFLFLELVIKAKIQQFSIDLSFFQVSMKFSSLRIFCKQTKLEKTFLYDCFFYNFYCVYICMLKNLPKYNELFSSYANSLQIKMYLTNCKVSLSKSSGFIQMEQENLFRKFLLQDCGQNRCNHFQWENHKILRL